MSSYTHQRPHSGAQVGDLGTGRELPPPASAVAHHNNTLHQQPQPVASSSRIRNPQLGPTPFFQYPTPNPDQIEDELPPYWEQENVPLGPLLDRLTRKAYNDMRKLVETTLPPLPPNQRPKPIIEYAKTTRQAVLKYLAVLRWKSTVDLATSSAPTANGTASGPTASFPTPHSNSNGESNNTSPTAFPLKGKARLGDSGAVVVTNDEPRGKVTDARRIQQFLEHQNAQHEAAIAHIQHVTKLVDTLRERNADLLTALSLRSAGTYTRLPSSLTEFFEPQPPLTPASMIDTVQRLDDHLRFRLKCVDYVPPELVIDKIADGRMYVRGGGPNGWVAQLSVVGFDEDSRWWLTGVEWAWRVDGARTAKEFTAEERQQILDVANMEILVPRTIPDDVKPAHGQTLVDSPLVRIYNFLQHLSLTYQLEVLFTQAVTLSHSRWRGNLLVDVDRVKKELRLRYWTRPRAPPPAPAGPTQAAVGRRPQPIARAGSTPVGGTLMLSIAESKNPISEAEQVLREVVMGDMVPTDRVLRLEIGMKWEVGEVGVGGGLKANEPMDLSPLKLNPMALSAKTLLSSATRTHATILARSILTPLLFSPRVTLDPLNPPRIIESDSLTRPLSVIVPVPAQHGEGGQFVVSVSATSGLIEIEDTTAKDNGQGLENNRTLRAKMASAAVNEQRGRLTEDVYRLMLTVIMEDVEDNLRQLGLSPVRRVALRTNDLAKTDLGPASTVFVPLPVSDSHYFVCKATADGLAYELLKLLRIPLETGGGLKLAVGDRTPIDLGKLVERRNARGAKRSRDDDGMEAITSKLEKTALGSGTCKFQFNYKDFKDMFFYCNALVAQTMVEQQLKDRGIPYTAHFPDDSEFPTARSRSALAGMVPHLCVNASDLFKDGRAAEVAAPKVFLVINDWWKGAKCSVETIVRLRHRPSVTSTTEAATPTSSSAARDEGIKFDPVTSTVRFRAPKIAQCVPDFLEQWERLSKVIVVAGEVNRLNRTGELRDIRLISFDLCTATLQYAPGYHVAITYSPTSDSYQASFFRAQPTSTPAAHLQPQEEESPHQPFAQLLSHFLNELTTTPQPAEQGSAGKQFISLLRATLPLLQEADSLRATAHGHFPALVVRSVSEYRLVWDNEGVTRYALDCVLTSDARSFLLTDASRPKAADLPADLTCGPLTALPNLERIVLKGFQAARATRVATPGSVSVSTPAAAMTPAARPPGAVSHGNAHALTQTAQSVPAALRLDGGHSLLCSIGVVQDVLRAMGAEVENAIAAAHR